MFSNLHAFIHFISLALATGIEKSKSKQARNSGHYIFFFVVLKMFFVKNKSKLLSVSSLLVRQTLQRYRHCSAEASRPALRFIQFQRQNSNCSRLGVVSEDGTNLIDLGSQGMFPHKMTHLLQSKYCIVELEKSLEKLSSEKVTDSVQILSPITAPDKILAISPAPDLTQAAAKCSETHGQLRPIIMSKLPNSLVGPTGAIVLPRGVTEIECRTELAVVIGKDAKNVAADDVQDYIFGYTIGLHVQVSKFDDTTLDLGDQKLITSSSDTFFPLGPTVVHKSLIASPANLVATLRVNDMLAQNDNTNDMAFSIAEMIEFITQFISLRPGDVILTGPPSETSHTHRCCTATAKAGDTIECEIEGIGKLRNEVVDGK